MPKPQRELTEAEKAQRQRLADRLKDRPKPDRSVFDDCGAPYLDER